METGVVRIAEDSDFEYLKKLVDVHDGWKLEYDKPDVRVWTEASIPESGFKMIKIVAVYADVRPEVLYDVLHDPDYRRIWDNHMLCSEDIGYLNINNDVGYYAMSCPAPLKNRDFVLQRSWLDTGEEKMILNHSVYHKDYPPKKGFVRAISIMTGFIIRPAISGDTGEVGSRLGYVSRTDPRGQLPSWLVNKITNIFAPKMAQRLYKAARGYAEWKSSQPVPGYKPWSFPDQVQSNRISIDECADPTPPKVPEKTDSAEPSRWERRKSKVFQCAEPTPPKASEKSDSPEPSRWERRKSKCAENIPQNEAGKPDSPQPSRWERRKSKVKRN